MVFGRHPPAPSPFAEVPNKGVDVNVVFFHNPCVGRPRIVVEFPRNQQQRFRNLYFSRSNLSGWEAARRKASSRWWDSRWTKSSATGRFAGDSQPARRPAGERPLAATFGFLPQSYPQESRSISS